MHRTVKKGLSIIIAIAMCLPLLPMIAIAVDEVDEVEEFEITNGVLTQYNGTGGNVIIPSGITRIGNGAFMACADLKSLVMPNSVTSIGDRAFSNCTGLISITIPNSVTSIDFGAFNKCTSLSSITIPNNLSSIENWLFYGCTSLKSMTIPGSVTKIDGEAFSGCTNLISVIIPNSVTLIREEAFYNCPNLTIYGTANSVAEKHAKENGIPFSTGTPPLMPADPPAPPVIPVTDEPSAWAVEEVKAAIDAGLVPDALQKNYRNSVTRAAVAQMFINLLEVFTGPIDDFIAALGYVINDEAFTDTSDKAVLAANALGIINGIGNNKFDPDGILQRAQIAAIINRLAGVLGVHTQGYTHPFTDAREHWVNSELGWPAHEKIIRGRSESIFDPNGKLTTEEAIAITYRALEALSRLAPQP